jgi:hypothetical protein
MNGNSGKVIRISDQKDTLASTGKFWHSVGVFHPNIILRQTDLGQHVSGTMFTAEAKGGHH